MLKTTKYSSLLTSLCTSNVQEIFWEILLVVWQIFIWSSAIPSVSRKLIDALLELKLASREGSCFYKTFLSLLFVSIPRKYSPNAPIASFWGIGLQWYFKHSFVWFLALYVWFCFLKKKKSQYTKASQWLLLSGSNLHRLVFFVFEVFHNFFLFFS